MEATEKAKQRLGKVGQILVDVGVAGTQLVTDAGKAALKWLGSAAGEGASAPGVKSPVDAVKSGKPLTKPGVDNTMLTKRIIAAREMLASGEPGSEIFSATGLVAMNGKLHDGFDGPIVVGFADERVGDPGNTDIAAVKSAILRHADASASGEAIMLRWATRLLHSGFMASTPKTRSLPKHGKVLLGTLTLS